VEGDLDHKEGFAGSYPNLPSPTVDYRALGPVGKEALEEQHRFRSTNERDRHDQDEDEEEEGHIHFHSSSSTSASSTITSEESPRSHSSLPRSVARFVAAEEDPSSAGDGWEVEGDGEVEEAE